MQQIQPKSKECDKNQRKKCFPHLPLFNQNQKNMIKSIRLKKKCKKASFPSFRFSTGATNPVRRRGIAALLRHKQVIVEIMSIMMTMIMTMTMIIMTIMIKIIMMVMVIIMIIIDFPRPCCVLLLAQSDGDYCIRIFPCICLYYSYLYFPWYLPLLFKGGRNHPSIVSSTSNTTI